MLEHKTLESHKSVASLSIGTSLESLSNRGSTPLKHLPRRNPTGVSLSYHSGACVTVCRTALRRHIWLIAWEAISLRYLPEDLHRRAMAFSIQAHMHPLWAGRSVGQHPRSLRNTFSGWVWRQRAL